MKKQLLTIMTPPGEKNDPKRMTQVIFPRKYHGFNTTPGNMPNPYRFADKIKIEFRNHDGALVVHLNVNDMMSNRRYRSTVRALFGWSFGRLVHRRIRSHRRWGKGSDQPYINDSTLKSIAQRIVSKGMQASRQPTTMASSTTEQLAAT